MKRFFVISCTIMLLMGVEKFVRQTQLQRVERNMQCDRKTIISLTLISYQEKVLISHMWPPTCTQKTRFFQLLYSNPVWFDSYQLNSCRRLWPQTGINAPIIHLPPPKKLWEVIYQTLSSSSEEEPWSVAYKLWVRHLPTKIPWKTNWSFFMPLSYRQFSLSEPSNQGSVRLIEAWLG